MTSPARRRAEEIVTDAAKDAEAEGFKLNKKRTNRGLMPLWGEEASIKPFLIRRIEAALVEENRACENIASDQHDDDGGSIDNCECGACLAAQAIHSRREKGV